MKNLMTGSATIALIAGASLVSAPANAQGGQSGATGLEEIVVTAQRRSESLQDVPISVTALSASEIARSGIQTSQDIAVATPGLTMTTNRNGLTPVLRGVGTQSNNSEGSIALYVDNVYYGSAAGSIFGLNNIERVEVLKGPQGTLFGRNATGGLLHVITRDPSDRPELKASVGYGNYDTITGNLYATTGIAPGVAMNIALYGSHQGEGWGTNVFLDEDVYFRNEWSVRSKLKLDPADGTSIILAGDYVSFETDIGSQRQVIPGAFAAGGVGHAGSYYDINSGIPSDGGGQFGDGLNSWNFGFSGTVNQELSDDITLTSITAYRSFRTRGYLDNDLTPARAIDAFFSDATKTFQQEVLVNGGADRLKWTVGGIYYRWRSGLDPQIVVSDTIPPANSIERSAMTSNSWAIYGQGSYELSDNTTLTLGGRYTLDRLRISTVVSALDGTVNTDAGTAGQPRDRTHVKWSRPTWRIALDHQFTPDILAYITYNRGYKAGAFNPGTPPSVENQSPAGDAVDPEILDAYEVGLKTELLDRQLRFNIAGFYYDYQDIQLFQLAPDGISTLILNATSAEIKGLEMEAVFAPRMSTGRLQFRVSGTVLDAKYGDFPNAPSNVPNDPAVGGNSPPADPINASGNRVIRAPKFSSTVSLDYALPVGADYEAGFNVNWQHNSRYYFEVDNRVSQNPTDLVNAQLSFGRADEAWGLRLWARNLTNEKYLMTINTSGFGDGGVPSPPRTYGVTLDVKFGG